MEAPWFMVASRLSNSFNKGCMIVGGTCWIGSTAGTPWHFWRSKTQILQKAANAYKKPWSRSMMSATWAPTLHQSNRPKIRKTCLSITCPKSENSAKVHRWRTGLRNQSKNQNHERPNTSISPLQTNWRLKPSSYFPSKPCNANLLPSPVAFSIIGWFVR